MKKKRNDKIYSDDLALFPNFKTFLNDLTNLEKLDFQNKTPLEIYHLYFDYARIMPSGFGIFNPEKFNKHSFYRARLNINKKIEDITLIQTYSNPPTAFCHENGRANLKNRSVFYCSNNPNAAIIESKPKIGDEGFLSVWKGNSRRPIKIGVCLPYDLPEVNEWNLMAKDTFEYFIKELPKKTKDRFQHYMALNKFIASRYVNENKPYPLTSMISNEMLFGELWRDFIIYPSVIAKSNYCNMAFHPNSVNQNLNFEKVIKFKVNDIVDGNVKFFLGKKVGKIQDTKITWTDITEKEKRIFVSE